MISNNLHIIWITLYIEFSLFRIPETNINLVGDLFLKETTLKGDDFYDIKKGIKTHDLPAL